MTIIAMRNSSVFRCCRSSALISISGDRFTTIAYPCVLGARTSPVHEVPCPSVCPHSERACSRAARRRHQFRTSKQCRFAVAGGHANAALPNRPISSLRRTPHDVPTPHENSPAWRSSKSRRPLTHSSGLLDGRRAPARRSAPQRDIEGWAKGVRYLRLSCSV